MKEKISVFGTIGEAIVPGIKNIPSIFAAVVLWALTIWIPYINVGTTIALYSMPLELAKGGIYNPLKIFDAEYRKYMGGFFILFALMCIALIPAYLFLIVPGVILEISWGLAILLLIDKKLAPMECLKESARLTDGNKGRIFLIILVIAVASYIPVGISAICCGFTNPVYYTVSSIMSFIEAPVLVSCYTLIYKKLTAAEPEVTEI